MHNELEPKLEPELELDLTRLHTTPLGDERIRKNLGLTADTDSVGYCRELISGGCEVSIKGKNHYFSAGGVLITVNSRSLTIITAHKIR